jgi:uncharacterized protein (DUF2267 family)
MNYDELVELVQERGALESADEARRVLAVTARVLGQRLMPDEAKPIADVLPEAVAERLRATAYERDFEVDELFDRVARGEGAGKAFGKEHAEVVCQIIGDLLPDAARMRLSRHLGPAFARLFEPRPPPSRPPRHFRASPGVDRAQQTTLATGRPGSHNPLSDGAPDLAHTHSVARSDDPHADTRLSSAAGLTQERLGDSLATGAPGPAHPVAETKR